jgi:hypothetical protein
MNEWDECCCAKASVELSTTCLVCSAPMVAIDFATGEPLAEASP